MGFGGKNRGKTGRPIARKRNRQVTRAIRRQWNCVAITCDGETPGPGFSRYQELVEATEKAINELLLGETLAMVLDASMAPRRVIGVDPAAIPMLCTCVCFSRDFDALRCYLPSGHADWHQDATGARWCIDDRGDLLVQPTGFLDSITQSVQVKP